MPDSPLPARLAEAAAQHLYALMAKGDNPPSLAHAPEFVRQTYAAWGAEACDAILRVFGETTDKETFVEARIAAFKARFGREPYDGLELGHVDEAGLRAAASLLLARQAGEVERLREENRQAWDEAMRHEEAHGECRAMLVGYRQERETLRAAHGVTASALQDADKEMRTLRAQLRAAESEHAFRSEALKLAQAHLEVAMTNWRAAEQRAERERESVCNELADEAQRNGNEILAAQLRGWPSLARPASPAEEPR